MFKNFDIKELLEKEKLDFKEQSEHLVEEALEILNETYYEDLIISESVKSKTPIETTQEFVNQNNLEEQLVYSSEIIENICIKYRLRFLDSDLFLGKIPYEANIKLKSIRKSTGLEFKNFKILAPESQFKLKNSHEDPILFAQINKHQYYLIHKWGDDMKWYKKLVYYPLRDARSLGISSILLGLLITLLLPSSIYADFVNENLFVALVVKINLAFVISGGVFVSFIIIGILRAKDFSRDIWNSNYFN